MYFMSVRLHITCEVNQNDYLLIHFDERRRGRDTVQYMDKIVQKGGREINYLNVPDV